MATSAAIGVAVGSGKSGSQMISIGLVGVATARLVQTLNDSILQEPKMEIRSMSKGHYKQIGGYHIIKNRIKNLQTVAIQNIENELGSLRTASYPKLIEAVQNRWQHFVQLYANYSKPSFLKAKARARMFKQRAEDKVINLITWEGKKAVGFGDGSRFSGLRGLSSGAPMARIRRKALKKRNSITLVDEFRTSKLGCCCNVRVTHPKKRRYGPATNDNTRNGVSICTRCDKHGIAMYLQRSICIVFF